jgi:hypothetical protein
MGVGKGGLGHPGVTFTTDSARESLLTYPSAHCVFPAPSPGRLHPTEAPGAASYPAAYSML